MFVPMRSQSSGEASVVTASDSSIEGNRRDYNMSGNQTSGKEGGVQCVMMVVCIYV